MAESSLVVSSFEHGVYRLKLNRPEKRNALSLAMIEAIGEALERADKELSARVIVISAEGPVFSSGHDLAELTAARNNPDRGTKFFDRTMRACSVMMLSIVNHRLPVIAEVRGTAAAAGCQLVATCDLAIASRESMFVTPGVNIGLFCSTPMVALSRNVSGKHAMEMLLTGEPCTAEKAEKIGLINEAVSDKDLSSRIAHFAELIASKSTMTLKTGKQAFYNQISMPLPDAYEYCSQVMVENMLKIDAEEGINAFLEKRSPEWRDE